MVPPFKGEIRHRPKGTTTPGSRVAIFAGQRETGLCAIDNGDIQGRYV
jgi:hypothetical protein